MMRQLREGFPAPSRTTAHASAAVLLLALSLALPVIDPMVAGTPNLTAFAQTPPGEEPTSSSGDSYSDTSSDSDDSSTSDSGTDNQSSSSDGVVIKSVDTPGTVRVNNLANLEALLNIFANSLEIWGITGSGSFFFGSIVAFVRKHWIVGGLLLFFTPFMLVGGLATPGVINWIIESARDSSNMDTVAPLMALAVAVVWFICVFGVGFFPAIYAMIHKHSHKLWIFLTTFVAWIVPLGWPALLFWAYYDPEKEKAAKQIS